MKVLLLCAGYGTRLRRDLETAGEEFSHLLNLPKPLLPVGEKPLISRWVEQVKSLRTGSVEVALVANELYLEAFKKWREEEGGRDVVAIVSDGTSRNEDRLGAVACIQVKLNAIRRKLNNLC